MILLFECICGFKHDAKLNPGKPNLIECPQCGEKYRIDFIVKKLKGKTCYGKRNNKV